MLPVVNQLAKSILNHFIKLLHNTKGQFFGGFILGNEALAIDAVLDRSLVMRGAEFVEESEEKPADLLDITDSFDQVFKHPSLPFFSKQFAARTCGSLQPLIENNAMHLQASFFCVWACHWH